jgi:hypothetical protein
VLLADHVKGVILRLARVVRGLEKVIVMVRSRRFGCLAGGLAARDTEGVTFLGSKR